MVQDALRRVPQEALEHSQSWGVPELLNSMFKIQQFDECLREVIFSPPLFSSVSFCWQVPSLNDYYTPEGRLQLTPGPAHATLARFRCMVQDTLNSEYADNK